MSGSFSITSTFFIPNVLPVVSSRGIFTGGVSNDKTDIDLAVVEQIDETSPANRRFNDILYICTMPDSHSQKTKQEDKNAILLGWALLIAVVAILLDIFNREGDQKLANSSEYLTPEDQEKYLKALREGDSKVETEKGELAISS